MITIFHKGEAMMHMTGSDELECSSNPSIINFPPQYRPRLILAPIYRLDVTTPRDDSELYLLPVRLNENSREQPICRLCRDYSLFYRVPWREGGNITKLNFEGGGVPQSISIWLLFCSDANIHMSFLIMPLSSISA